MDIEYRDREIIEKSANIAGRLPMPIRLPINPMTSLRPILSIGMPSASACCKSANWLTIFRKISKVPIRKSPGRPFEACGM